MEIQKNRFPKLYFLLSILLLFIQDVNGQDIGATALVNPVSPMCPDTNQTITVAIQNFDAVAIDFSIDSVSVNVDITGASNQNFNVVLNSGTLAPGAKQNVIVSITTDLATNGTHVFNAYTILASDTDTSNDSIAQVSVTVNDVNPPVADVSLLPDLTAECSVTVSTIPTATDDCRGAINGITDDTLYYDEQGLHTITWTYDDGNGNTSTQLQNIIIDDVTAPVEDMINLPSITTECS